MRKTVFRALAALLIYFFITAGAVDAQESHVISDSIFSVALNEWRSVKVVLPENYETGSKEKYEVIYLTDGEWVVNLFPFIYEFARDEDYVPPAIIVALPNTYIKGANQRDRDFLPVNVPSPAISGGADKFLAFMKDELIPYIDKTYRTSGINSIYGHSYGGVFVTYTLLTQPQLFVNYYATDPPLGWNNDFLIKKASEKLNQLPPGKVYWLAGIESTYKGQGITKMDSILKMKAPETLSWKIATFPNEKHNSVRLKAMYDGIKYAYSGYPGTVIDFHPKGGIVLKDKPAMIFLLNDYTDLRYELDGTEPDRSSPKAENRLILTGPAQVVFKSFSTGGKYDQTARGNFVLGETFPSLKTPKRYKAGGLNYSFYHGEWGKMPDFKKLKPAQRGITDSLFSMNKLPAKSNFAILIEGMIEITDDGYYLFALVSNDGSKLYLSDKLIIDNDGIHKEESIQSYLLPLEKGFYPIRLEYFQSKEDHILQFYYLIPGGNDPIPVPINRQYNKK